MPELPEVETVVRGLAKSLPGRTVLAVEGIAPTEITGHKIEAVDRYGKFIVLRFDHGLLLVHLRMTGQLLSSDETSKFTRARIHLDEGTLRYDDIRKFGRLTFTTALPTLGPDPLELTAQEFIDHTHPRRARIKALLLDQSFLRGMGNIYADESLFAARIHPQSIAAALKPAQLRHLHESMQAVLQAAITAGGSSISDYVDSTGARGTFQQQHQVYGKHGQPCPRCATPLERTLIAQRGTTFCPHCQKR